MEADTIIMITDSVARVVVIILGGLLVGTLFWLMAGISDKLEQIEEHLDKIVLELGNRKH